MRRRCAAAAALLALLAPVAARAVPSSARLFPQQADLFVERDGLVRLVLPPEVMAECRPDLSDLRIFDRAGREVPFVVDASPSPDGTPARVRTLATRITGVTRRLDAAKDAAPSVREEYAVEVEDVAALTAAGQALEQRRELVIETSRPRFVRSVEVAEVGADGSRTLATGGIFRLEGAARTRIPLPASGGRLSIRIAGREDFYLEPSFGVELVSGGAPPARGEVPLAIDAIRPEPGRTLLELPRPAGLVPDALRIDTATPSFVRHLSVVDLRPGRPDARIGGGDVFRVPVNAALEHLEVRVAPAAGSRLRIEIDDRDSPPLDGVAVHAIVRQPALVFAVPAARDGVPDATLRFGGGRAARPSYDLTALAAGGTRSQDLGQALASLRGADAQDSAGARLGAIRASADFDATPALGFAMQPGAPIDPRLYARRRELSVAPSSEGLSRLRLGGADVAAARADLADLRIVDAQRRQWPYLIEPDAADEWVELSATGADERAHETHRHLALPDAPVRAASVEIEVDAPFFDRPYRLLAHGEGDRERVLAAGRLARRAGESQPIAIGFAPQRIEGRELVLVVQEGDDAPLPVRRVRARLLVPELFLVAPPGEYALLVGDPDAEAPRYEVAQVRDVVLAVASVPVRVGSAQANPEYSARARLASGGRPERMARTALVWATLLLAVAVLAGLTLRAARREDAGDEPPSA